MQGPRGSVLPLFIGGLTLLGCARGSYILDAHVHSLMDWSRVNYTYAKSPSTIYYHNWTYDDYCKAVRPSALEPTEFMFMALHGVPKDQFFLQSRLAYEQARDIDASGQSPRMVGIIANADLQLDDDLPRYLDDLVAAVPIVKGVRPDSWDGPRLRGSLEALQVRRLVFELYRGYGGNISHLCSVLKQLPNLTVVVDHMGLDDGPPPLSGQTFAAWAAQMANLAQLPNVYVKISGGQAPGYAVQALLPLFEHLWATFGPRRCIYAGNWFVADTAEGFYSYRAWAVAVAQWMDSVSAAAEDRDWLLSGAGRLAYRINTKTELPVHF